MAVERTRISLLPSAVGVGLVWAVCRARKKADKQKPAGRHHRGSGFCGFGYCAAVALANAQNYLKYISDNAAPKNGVAFCI